VKVNRQGLSESYKTTADWISDFEKGLSKEGNYLENLKTIMRKRTDFSTIEEKMADIRDRAGFELLKDVGNTAISKKASECNACDGACSCRGCSCNRFNCKSCNSDFIDKVKVVIKYIDDMINNKVVSNKEPLSIHAIIDDCRQNKDLGFQQIENNLNSTKFRAFLEDMLNKVKDSEEDSLKKVKYTPEDGAVDTESDMADYYSHSLPG